MLFGVMCLCFNGPSFPFAASGLDLLEGDIEQDEVSQYRQSGERKVKVLGFEGLGQSWLRVDQGLLQQTLSALQPSVHHSGCEFVQVLLCCSLFWTSRGTPSQDRCIAGRPPFPTT